MKSRRLHRVLRFATIALVAGVLGDVTFEYCCKVTVWIEQVTGLEWLVIDHGFTIAWVAALVALAMAANSWLDRREQPQVESVPHCRHCGYIVVGLSQPLCPECGSEVDGL